MQAAEIFWTHKIAALLSLLPLPKHITQYLHISQEYTQHPAGCRLSPPAIGLKPWSHKEKKSTYFSSHIVWVWGYAYYLLLQALPRRGANHWYPHTTTQLGGRVHWELTQADQRTLPLLEVGVLLSIPSNFATIRYHASSYNTRKTKQIICIYRGISVTGGS